MRVIVTLHDVETRAVVDEDRAHEHPIAECCVAVTHVLVKKIEKVPKVTLYAYLFKPNPPNSAK